MKGNVLQTYLVVGLSDDIILEKLSRHLKFDKEASEISPLLQLWNPL